MNKGSRRLWPRLADRLRGLSGESRFAPWRLAIVLFLVVSSATRVVLIVTNWGQILHNLPGAFAALGVGILFDLIAAAWLLFPFMLYLALMPNRWFQTRISLWVTSGAWFLFLFALLFLGVTEYYFFDEFSSRFNSVAVDYLIFPHEVFANIWATYPVWKILIIDAVASALLFFFLRRQVHGGVATPARRRNRFVYAGCILTLAVLVTWLTGPRLAEVSPNRIVDQIALNGVYSFALAAVTNELDYDTYYSRIDSVEAFTRLRGLLQGPGVTFLQPAESLSIDRRIAPSGSPRRLNIVIVLEESFGSNFVRSLDSAGPGGTPEFEKFADKGLLFTNIYATGNRTVRGMEGLLLGFPPIPGQSIVRRPGGRHVFSLPTLLQEEGYQTAFIYGGFSYFDNMKEFAETNGFDRVIDRLDFAKRTFATVWGVCDEDLFDNSLNILDTMFQAGKPFFSLLLTVSNHSPYTYPAGRIAEDPNEQKRENAVRYMDYSLGRFLQQAQSHAFFDSTIFVVLGDHGARVYGSQTIPMKSYRIPVLMYAPSVLAAGQRNGVLGSQIDVAPTLMSLLNLTYNSQFFGRNLLGIPPKSGAALLSHNRDVALLRDNQMGVLGLRQEKQLWIQDPHSHEIRPEPIEQDTAILADAIAYFQSAYYLYKNHRLHPLGQPEVINSRALAASR